MSAVKSVSLYTPRSSAAQAKPQPGSRTAQPRPRSAARRDGTGAPVGSALAGAPPNPTSVPALLSLRICALLPGFISVTIATHTGADENPILAFLSKYARNLSSTLELTKKNCVLRLTYATANDFRDPKSYCKVPATRCGQAAGSGLLPSLLVLSGAGSVLPWCVALADCR